MQFPPDEYLLLSRRGSVPSPTRAGPRPPDPQPEVPAQRQSPRQSAVRRTVNRRVRAMRALHGGLQSTWTAFGPGGRDL